VAFKKPRRCGRPTEEIMACLRLKALVASAALIVTSLSAFAEAGKLRVAKQYGLGYLQLMVMEDQKLIEKHAKQAGLGDVTVDWGTFRSSDVMNDALISRNLDFACLGLPGLITIWSKTRGNYDVRGATGLNVVPLILNVREPSINSLKDFKDEHRIALPAVKVSMQAIILQMAAAKEFGRGEVVANFSSSPFQYRQQKQPGIRQIFTSEEVLGGPVSFNVIATTAKFREENPKLYASFLAALQEATDFINKDKGAAAEIYLKLSSDKSPKEEIVELMSKPGVRFTTELFGLDKFAAFMAKAGSLKNPPKDWRAEMTFPEAKYIGSRQ
jgi:NitT/TauT family transport system substrate-binding protein